MARPHARTDETRRELLALLFASLACVTVLVVSIIEARGPLPPLLAPSNIMLVAVFAGLVAGAAGLAFVVTQRARRAANQARDDAVRLQRELIVAEAVFKAEPQILVFWEHGAGLKVVAHTLLDVAGIPHAKSELLKFGWWLDRRSAEDLKAALDALFEQGVPFNLFLKTKPGAHIEADGRAAGGRAILRIRDVAGYKDDLVQIIEQQRKLTQDIAACRAVLDALPMPVWLRTSDGRLNWVNQAYVTAVEADDSDEVITQQIELLEGRQRAALAIHQGGASAHQERMPLMIGGERRPHDVIIAPGPQSTAAAAIDVTDLAAAQNALDKQTLAYDRVLDRVSTAIAIFNQRQQLTFYNNAYAKLWELDTGWLDQGPTDAQVLDRLRELSRLPFVSDYRSWKQEILSCYDKRKEREDLWHLPDGRMLGVVAEQRPDGGVTYLFEDRSEQYLLESRYKTLIQVQGETLDSLREGVAVFGTDARLRLSNLAFAHIWRLSRNALAQRPHVDELVAAMRPHYDVDDDWRRITGAVTTLTTENRALSGTMERPDGSYVDYASAALPDGGTLVTFTDVSATRRYQRALLERNEALEAADRLKSTFISHVSYELRTPLTDIIGFSELLQSPRTGPLNTKQQEYLGAVAASSRTLRSVIDNILDLTSIDAGAVELVTAEVSVPGLIDAAIDAVRERAHRVRVSFDVGISDDAHTFVADEHRMRQVLYNLLSNAIGFSPMDSVVFISAYLDGAMIVFEITDQGVGIPEDERAHVFERFVSRAQGSKHRGAGLGLSISKSLVELHHGDIAIDAPAAGGTRVTLRLPRFGIETDSDDVGDSAEPLLEEGASQAALKGSA